MPARRPGPHANGNPSMIGTAKLPHRHSQPRRRLVRRDSPLRGVTAPRASSTRSSSILGHAETRTLLTLRKNPLVRAFSCLLVPCLTNEYMSRCGQFYGQKRDPRVWALAAGLGHQTPGLKGPAAAQAQPIYIEVEPSEPPLVVGFAAKFGIATAQRRQPQRDLSHEGAFDRLASDVPWTDSRAACNRWGSFSPRRRLVDQTRPQVEGLSQLAHFQRPNPAILPWM
jgi:hypothetical protein